MPLAWSVRHAAVSSNGYPNNGKHKEQPMSKPKITLEISQLLNRLIREYPQCFKPESQEPVPLAYSIHWQILELTYPDTPPLVVRDALKVYTNRPAYRECLKPGATRYNLQGEAAGVVEATSPPQPENPPAAKPKPKGKKAKQMEVI
jgi:sRNA-binding protein